MWLVAMSSSTVGWSDKLKALFKCVHSFIHSLIHSFIQPPIPWPFRMGTLYWIHIALDYETCILVLVPVHLPTFDLHSSIHPPPSLYNLSLCSSLLHPSRFHARPLCFGPRLHRPCWQGIKNRWGYVGNVSRCGPVGASMGGAHLSCTRYVLISMGLRLISPWPGTPSDWCIRDRETG